jgi:hypothetical protein
MIVFVGKVRNIIGNAIEIFGIKMFHHMFPRFYET